MGTKSLNTRLPGSDTVWSLKKTGFNSILIYLQIPNTTYNPDLVKFREKLPVYEQRQDLIDAVIHNQVSK